MAFALGWLLAKASNSEMLIKEDVWFTPEAEEEEETTTDNTANVV